jgi:hypothetical protein
MKRVVEIIAFALSLIWDMTGGWIYSLWKQT